MRKEACLSGFHRTKFGLELPAWADITSDIMIDIISRLPIKTILSCKCVCKSWLNSLTSPEFVKSHLSKSKLPALIFFVYENDDNIPSLYHVIESESYSTITVFSSLEFSGCCKDTFMAIRGSVNGLMSCCMVKRHPYSHSNYICNPVTREYMELPYPQERASADYKCCGFGVSKTNGQYKVVQIYFDSTERDHLRCDVYTLGTRSWRTIPFATTVPPFGLGAFLNGNLHGLMMDDEGRYSILCLDLETELFSTFSTPVRYSISTLIGSGDCLHLIDYESNGDEELVVWSMKEYGVDESWTKECVISGTWFVDGQSYTAYHVINISSNGDILVELSEGRVLCYSSKSKTGRVMSIPELPLPDSHYEGMLHSPSFISLKNSFAMEDVKLF